MDEQIETDDIKGDQKRKNTPTFNEELPSSRKHKASRSDIKDILENEGNGVIKAFVEPLVYIQGQGHLQNGNKIGDDRNPRHSLESDAKKWGNPEKPHRKSFNHHDETAKLRHQPQGQGRKHSGDNERGTRNSFDKDRERRNSVEKERERRQSLEKEREKRHSLDKERERRHSLDKERERRHSLDKERGRRNSLDKERERRHSIENGKERRNSVDYEQDKRYDHLRPDARRRNSVDPPSPPNIEKADHDIERKGKNENPAMFNVVKMTLSRQKRVTIVEELPAKVKKKVRNSAKALLVKKRASKAALPPVVPVKPSVDGEEAVEENEENDQDQVGPQPPPYWEELLANRKFLIKRLKSVPDIGEAVDHNPDFLTYVFRHPRFGAKVIIDPEVAHDVIEHPTNFKEIAHKGNVKKNLSHFQPEQGHPIIFLGHKYHIDDIRIHLEDRAPIISRSDISLERDQLVYDANHGHILKALLGVERVYLRHDEIVYEGILVFCDRKLHRYFFLDINGKVIYHIRDYQFFSHDCFRRFDYGLLDQEGNEILRMTKRCSLTCKQKVDVFCPPGHFIGYVSQSYGIATPSFWVKNHEKHEFIEIRSCGRNWKSYCNKNDYKFEFILKVVATQHDMGLISTMWFEKQMETFSFEPFYGIHWNDDMTLNVKGLLLSSMLLVYLTHYNGRLDKRLYIERYKKVPRPSYSVCEEDLEN